ncbi:alpha/beta hydrolase [Clostridium botulinum]|nr:alpha/beta hydrolase [Clostridium botulinum]
MKIKMITRLIASSLVVFSLAGCSNNGSTANSNSNGTQSSQTQSTVLNFNKDNYTAQSFTVNGEEVKFRAYENIVYVENPVDEKYQSMNIYIPEAYFNGESIGKFTADTAPIFLPNNVGGYMPSEPGTPSMNGKIDGEASRMGMTNNNDSKGEGSPNSLLLALSKGYVVASPGARGRTNESDDGTYYGKAPAGLVDLKAAVRYLHYNDNNMLGDANKIISNGTSAGGAMSSLLGSTGNNSDYDSYLKEIGAADASDAIYAVSSYCPITNLENADMGYEWLFNGLNSYEKMNITKVDGQMKREKLSLTQTEDQMKYSDELKSAFPAYVNSLNLKDENGNVLTLNEDGNGTFKDYIKNILVQSAQIALDSGIDLSSYTWVKVSDKTVTDIDFEGYVSEYLGRSKAAPAFDGVDLSNPENNEFGTETIEAQHFTQFGLDNDTAGGTLADSQLIKMMNPMNYIGADGTDVAKYWRIRHGAKDSDTAISTPTILALTIQSNGGVVDFAVPWTQGHGGDYDLNELFEWMNSIS